MESKRQTSEAKEENNKAFLSSIEGQGGVVCNQLSPLLLISGAVATHRATITLCGIFPHP